MKASPTSLAAVVDQQIAGNHDFSELRIVGGLAQGVTFRNANFQESHFADLGLSASLFEDCDLWRTVFRATRLGGYVTFRRCNISEAKFDRAMLSGVSFEQCRMFHSNFYATSLETTVFQGCMLRGARFIDATLRNVTFPQSDGRYLSVDSGIFIGCNVSELAAERLISFDGKTTLDWTTIFESRNAQHLEELLVRSGMPELFATYSASCARALDPQLLHKLMKSTFISYGGSDTPFAWRLRDDLRRNGVQTFFFATDAVPGERLHEVMRLGVNRFDRVIVVCSENALGRPGLRNEVTETLAREARDGGASYLIPITIDKHVFTSSDQLAGVLRERVVADFSDDQRYEESFIRLLNALRTDTLENPGGA